MAQQKKFFETVDPQTRWLMVLFFISGFAALIYQVVWQRALFQYFGVNMESITIIVSVFMFGLGVGSLVGGTLSKRFPNRCLQLFLLFEFLTAAFGCISIHLMNAVAHHTVQNTLFQDAMTIYLLLAIPTTLMGATLPLLCSHVFKNQKNAGATVSLLYFINALGASLACFFCVHVLFLFFGLKFSVVFAALCNLAVVLLGLFKVPRDFQAEKAPAPQALKTAAPEAHANGRFWLMVLVSCLTGFISMSQEILWFRYFSLATGGHAQIFPYVLGVFLFGLAIGSSQAKRLCETYADSLLPLLGGILIAAGTFFYFSLPGTNGLLYLLSHSPYWRIALLFLLFCATLIAGTYGVIFPLVNHYAITSQRNVGQSVSYLYFANIVGSTTGPLLTGFYLLDRFDFDHNVLFFSVLSIVLGWGLLLMDKSPVTLKKFAPITAIALLGFFGQKALYYRLIENTLRFDQLLSNKVENRGGTMVVFPVPGEADTLWGDGVYDGRYNTDVVSNPNGLRRVCALGALRPHMKSALEIGLATGSWAWTLSKMSTLEKFDIVEINPGYLELMKPYPELYAITQNPLIQIYIDDGRRWLRKNPDRKYDVIMMNTTYHFRSQASNLLSTDFYKLAKAHLNEGGVVSLNTTGSMDVVFTAAHVFKHVIMIGNMVTASDAPFNLSEDERRAGLLKFVENGQPLFLKDEAHKQVLEDMVQVTAFTDIRDHLLQNASEYNLITDDNLASEFKSNKILSAAWFRKRFGTPPEKQVLDFEGFSFLMGQGRKLASEKNLQSL